MPTRPATRRHRRRAAFVLGAAVVAAGGAGALAVAAPTNPGVGLSVSPGTLSLSAGDQGVFDVSIKRKAFPGPVGLSVSGLPAGASGAFAPVSTTGDAAMLTVTTGPGTALGTYTFTITGASTLGTSSVTGKLTVGQSTRTNKAFTIGGSLTRPLAPGRGVPLNLSVTNPNPQAISVTNLHVTISVPAPYDATCDGPANLTVAQIAPASYPLTVPAGATRSLEQLGLAASAWPVVAMLDTPHNQDGCKDAQFALSYTGTAQGAN